MVVSQIQQPEGNYLLWKRFLYPTEDGPVDAIAVSAGAQRYISSAYTLMSTLTVVHLWAIILAVGFYFYLRPTPKNTNRVSDISVSLWNKRGATEQSIMDTLRYARDDLKKWWYYPLLFAIAAAWAAGIAAGVLIPSRVFLGNAAPVNPAVIYAPSVSITGFPEIYDKHALDTQPALRAAGAALVANETIRGRVSVGQPIQLGKFNDTESIVRIEYSYKVTGTDLGLQKLPKIQLNVTGACTTDYTWFTGSVDLQSGDKMDTYKNIVDGSEYDVSIIDSLAPSAIFVLPRGPPISDRLNTSWVAIVSSVSRYSFTTSEDPWYKTEPNPRHNASERISFPPNMVRPGRPVLSCWQSDLWTYDGRAASIVDLDEIVPPDTLSKGLHTILTSYLSLPAIVNLGRHLGVSSLQSSATAVNNNFDAGASSIHNDLRQLLLGAYISTVDTLTDTTLYQRPEENAIKKGIPNMARDSLDVPLDGVADFIVYSNKAAALSVTAVIVIPAVALGSWVLMQILLSFKPLKLATAMEAIEFFQDVKRQFGEPTVSLDKDGKPIWKFTR